MYMVNGCSGVQDSDLLASSFQRFGPSNPCSVDLMSQRTELGLDLNRTVIPNGKKNGNKTVEKGDKEG